MGLMGACNRSWSALKVSTISDLFFCFAWLHFGKFFHSKHWLHPIKSSPLHFNEKTWKGGIMWAGFTSQKVGLPLKVSNFWVLIFTCAQCNFFFAINWKNWNWLSSNWKQLRNFWIFIFTCAFVICCLSKICIKDLHQRFASKICIKDLLKFLVSELYPMLRDTLDCALNLML